jgi:hypothetical protein
MFSSARRFHPLRAAASAGLKGALPKVLLGAALLGGGGSVLFAGAAQAASELTFAQWASGTPLTINGKEFTYVSSLGLPGGTDLVSASLDNTGTYLFLYDFRAPNINPLPSFTLNYTANIIGAPDFFFTEVDIDSNVVTNLPSESLTATYTNVNGTAPGSSVMLQSINGSQNPAILPVAGQPTTLSVSNVYFSNGGSISQFQNSFRQGTPSTVPGPLPLLGAGMAFGFSRKLRSRIKARVQA